MTDMKGTCGADDDIVRMGIGRGENMDGWTLHCIRKIIKKI